jgi:hypothetical protein
MKIKFTAEVDLGDDFCDLDSIEEMKWAEQCVKDAYTIRIAEVDDDYPIKVSKTSCH